MNFAQLILTFVAFTAVADPSAPVTIKATNSKCFMKVSGGEYPLYKIYCGKNLIFAPKSDGIVGGQISPSGKYMALSAGETELIDIEKGKFEYGVAIINCETGKLKGYRKGQPTLIKNWQSDSKGLDLDDGGLRLDNLP